MYASILSMVDGDTHGERNKHKESILSFLQDEEPVEQDFVARMFSSIIEAIHKVSENVHDIYDNYLGDDQGEMC